MLLDGRIFWPYEIEKLYQAALEQEADHRGSFLAARMVKIFEAPETSGFAVMDSLHEEQQVGAAAVPGESKTGPKSDC